MEAKYAECAQSAGLALSENQAGETTKYSYRGFCFYIFHQLTRPREGKQV